MILQQFSGYMREQEEWFCMIHQPGIDVSDLGLAYNMFDDDRTID